MDEPPRFLPPPPLPPPPPPPPPGDSSSGVVGDEAQVPFGWPNHFPPVIDRPVIRWGMGDVLIGLFLWILGGVVASVIVLLVTDSSPGSGGNLADLGLGAIVVSLVAGWPGFLGWPIFATWLKGQRSLTKDFGLRIAAVDVGWGVLGGFSALFLSVVAGIVWRVLSQSPEPSNAEFLPTSPSAGTAIALLILVAVCTPIIEELFFRGLFLRAVGRRFGLPWAVVASSLVFGLLHFQGSGLHGLFISGVTATYGAVFALLVIRSGGRLGPSIVAHMVVNGVGVVAALYLA